MSFIRVRQSLQIVSPWLTTAAVHRRRHRKPCRRPITPWQKAHTPCCGTLSLGSRRAMHALHIDTPPRPKTAPALREVRVPQLQHVPLIAPWPSNSEFTATELAPYPESESSPPPPKVAPNIRSGHSLRQALLPWQRPPVWRSLPLSARSLSCCLSPLRFLSQSKSAALWIEPSKIRTTRMVGAAPLPPARREQRDLEGRVGVNPLGYIDYVVVRTSALQELTRAKNSPYCEPVLSFAAKTFPMARI
jgi:hypothetical protein